MSEHVYEFHLSIGFPNADQSEILDLVEDLGYDVEDLEDPKDLARVLDHELDEWQWQYIESWTDKVDDR